ncbi:MAG: alpha-L-arabinofuranosidase C-terminal domain-containing protein [Candidatus Methylacidiphilales bacterium]|nr:alpha-L-arabinofuranosidase C-terminal domain-containing protein [Candidatus Methylacidiphilales bacterium]
MNLIFACAVAALPPAMHAADPTPAPVAAPTQIIVDMARNKPISPDLFGLFFEDINYSADGGLYGELIQNRSFEYRSMRKKDWNSLSFWSLVQSEGGKGSLAIDEGIPVHQRNPNYLVLEVSGPANGVGIANAGFDGIPIKQGETYDASFFARQIYAERRNESRADIEKRPMPVTVRLEGKDGRNLGEFSLNIQGMDWKRYEGSITSTGSDDAARFVLLAKSRGSIGLDEISLFPRATFKGRKNGLRADLAQVIADLHPRFIRFPGGCLVHGNGLSNMYHWKNTVGPIEQRRQMPNIWAYHQSMGLGYFEYFQFCEDIGAKPLPVVAAGVSCQNSGYTNGHGQCAIPMEEMPAYVQDVLDLVEWANGPATSRWGSVRAAAGHPEPFGLQYIGVGNEDHITPEFRERFKMIYDAMKKAHPEIIVIGTVGPDAAGRDFEQGWKIAREFGIPMVDEHYYKAPQFFWNNLSRYDKYDRAASKVYLGEYAAHDDKRRSTLRSALAEAACMTALERNGDVVSLASYAPLLAKRGFTQWSPDMIYFTNTSIELTVNYWVQKLFFTNAGDTCLETTPSQTGTPADFAVSTVRQSKTGDVIMKIVNGSPRDKPLSFKLQGADNLPVEASLTVLAGADPSAVNDGKDATPTLPKESVLPVGPGFSYIAPANSLSVIRIRAGGKPISAIKQSEDTAR